MNYFYGYLGLLDLIFFNKIGFGIFIELYKGLLVRLCWVRFFKPSGFSQRFLSLG